MVASQVPAAARFSAWRAEGVAAVGVSKRHSSTALETGDHVRKTVRSFVHSAPRRASAAKNAGSSSTPRA